MRRYPRKVKNCQRFRRGIRPGIERLESRRLLSAASSYTWQNAAIDGGGFVDGIYYDTHNQNVMYVHTDIGGLYKSTNDGTTWTQLLDFVGGNTGTSGNGTQGQEIGVLSFAIDPQNSNNLYADVGEYSGTNGAVFYSTNAGATWSITNLSFYVGGNSNGRGDGEELAVDPNDSNIVFLGSNANGLWESTNAGHSFSEISTGTFSTSSSTTLVLFDPASGTPGNPSQTIYVGMDSTSTGTNLYETTNGGTSWSEVAGTGALPSGYLPGHAALSGGNLYLGYANAEAPSGSLTNGGVYRYTPSSGAWANISPIATNGNFGYDAVAADPENPNTVVVASFDYYSGPDQIWRTVNANAATPSWTELMDYASAQNSGYGGYNTTRNTSNAPWIAAYGDGIGNWAATVAIDPFNANQLMYGTGQGLWATNNASNGGANTKLTAANSWYFPDYGIEFTSVLSLATGASGLPLYSAMGDIFGFAHTTLTASSTYVPPATGTADTVAEGGGTVVYLNPNDYSTNDGKSYSTIATTPDGGSGGSVAVSANGQTIVWAPSGVAPYYSTNDGASWTASSGGMGAGGQVLADQQNASDFYYRAGTDVYFSSNGGASFSEESANAPNGSMAVSPLVSGDLWIATGGGVYYSTNFGATFTEASSVTNHGMLALGAPAPGQTLPAVYIFGTINNFQGIYRSDDGGVTWTQVNDVNHQWGGGIQTMAADPNVFGRVYLGINGRGIIMGNPASSLPANWADADINTPGNPGWAVSSTTLSSGTVVNRWVVDGGGAGLGLSSDSDQFNFAYEPQSGNGGISAQVIGMTNADGAGGTPEAGVMYRSATDANDPFVALVQSDAGTLIFEYRTTSGGAVTTTSLSGVPVGAEYLNIIRNGNAFTANYSANGTTWTELGSSVTISAMPSTANVGLIAASDYNAQLTSATFASLTFAPPTIVTPAAASPAPVTGTSTALSVLGASAAEGESSLVYTWSSTGTPPAPVTFSANGTNAAQDTTATFTKAGTYDFQVTIADTFGDSTTTSVVVTVNQTIASIALSPSGATVAPGGQKQFAATAEDQFGTALATQPAFTWSVYPLAGGGGMGTINASGLFTAGSSQVTGTVTVYPLAGGGAVSGSAIVGVSTLPAPVAWYPFAEGSGTTVHDASGNGFNGALSSSGATWSTGVGYPLAAVGGGDLAFNSGSVNLGSPSGLNVTGLITLSAWIDPKSSSGSYQDIVGRGYTENPDAETMLRINDGDYQVVAWNGTNYEASAAVPASDLNTWVQLVGVYNGTSWLLYRDGALLASTASTVGALQVAANWMIGSSGISTDPRYFNGSIGDVRIYNVALSAAQVATLYDSYYPPTVATPAAASPATVTATSTSLSALGASVAGASSLTYTWATTGAPPAPVTFSASGTTAAASTTATFTKAGTYAFQVTITDALGRTVTSSVNVTVNQTLTSITVSPAPANLNSSSTQQFTAVADDQFGNALTVQPALTWSVIGGGSITGNGLYTPPYSSGSATVYGTSGGLAGMASVTYSGQAQWASASGGTWGGSGNWQDTSSGTVLAAAPGVRGIIGDTALISSAAGSTITLDSANPNLAGLTFNSGSNGFTIAPGEAGGTLTLDNGTASANIAVAAGSQTISAPVVLESNVVAAPAAGSRLTISGPISGTGGALTLNGAGTLILSGANHYGGTTVAEGTLVVANSSALGAGSSLTVGAGAGLLFGSPLEASPAAAATPVTVSNAASVTAQAANSTFNSDRHDKQFPTVQALDAVFAQYGRG